MGNALSHSSRGGEGPAGTDIIVTGDVARRLMEVAADQREKAKARSRSASGIEGQRRRNSSANAVENKSPDPSSAVEKQHHRSDVEAEQAAGAGDAGQRIGKPESLTSSLGMFGVMMAFEKIEPQAGDQSPTRKDGSSLQDQDQDQALMLFQQGGDLQEKMDAFERELGLEDAYALTEEEHRALQVAEMEEKDMVMGTVGTGNPVPEVLKTELPRDIDVGRITELAKQAWSKLPKVETLKQPLLGTIPTAEAEKCKQMHDFWTEKLEEKIEDDATRLNSDLDDFLQRAKSVQEKLPPAEENSCLGVHMQLQKCYEKNPNNVFQCRHAIKSFWNCVTANQIRSSSSKP